MRVAAALAALALAGSARAGEPLRVEAGGEPEAEVGAAGALAIGASVVPGVLVHGAGHWVAGRRETGKRLLAASGVGLGVAALGGVPLVATGAGRRWSRVGVPLLVSGLGTFALSWIADVYGVAGGGAVFGDYAAPASVELEAGYGYIHDPQFAYGSFAVLGADLRAGRLRVSPSAWIALDDDNQRLRAELSWPLWRGGGGTRIEIGGAVTHHRYGSDGFFTTVGEVSIGGRLDLEALGPSLRGSFAELSTGAGLELLRFGAADEWGLNDLLLGRFAFGVYLGRRGELALYYDHRRDDFAAGLSPTPNQGSGFAGHFGLSSRLWLGERWGATAEIVSGAALIARVGAMMRFGGTGR